MEGWAEQSELTVLDIAQRSEDAGVAAIVYTDVARDGMLQGINWDATIALADAIAISSHRLGRTCVDRGHPRHDRAPCKKLEGAIAGRALYDGRLDPAEALKLIRAARAA